MNVLCSINHPAHVHFFRNLIGRLRGDGHAVVVTNREKEMTSYLLRAYGLESTSLSSYRPGLGGMAWEMVVHEARMLRLLRRRRIDVALSIGGTFIVHACALAGVPALAFTDTENAGIQNRITFPFATKIVTPVCYRDALGPKQVRYQGYHELAYLHPNRYRPDPAALEPLGVSPHQHYTVMRFVGWGAIHDSGHSGLSLENKRKAVAEFSRFGRVFITSETELPDDLEEYRCSVPPERMHDVLQYASLLYGESATMASECAVLGTPAIYVDDEGRGYTDEQERKYGAVFNFSESLADQAASIAKGVELLGRDKAPLKEEWAGKRRNLLDGSVDVTDWMLRLLEEYA